MEFWSQSENVPPLLVGPWESCLSPLSPGFSLHPWALERAGVGQVREEGQVWKGQGQRRQVRHGLRPGGIVLVLRFWSSGVPLLLRIAAVF